MYLQRLRSAPVNLNDGFSVVAPMSWDVDETVLVVKNRKYYLDNTLFNKRQEDILLGVQKWPSQSARE